MKYILSLTLLELKLSKKYKLHFCFDLLNKLLVLVLFFYLSQMMDKQTLAIDFFPFVTIGLCCQFLYASLAHSSLRKVSQWTQQKTIFGLYSLPSPIPQLIFFSGAPDILITTLKVTFLFLACQYLSPFKLQSPLLLLHGLGLLFLFSLNLSLLSLGSFFLWKRFNPSTLFSSFAFTLFSGVYFPLSLFPQWIQNIGQWNPLYKSLNLIRASFNLSPPLSSSYDLLTACALLTPLVLYFYISSFSHAQKLGRLEHI